MNNDQKIKEYKKSQLEKWIIVVLLIMVIVLETLALFGIINMLWGCGLFIIIYIIKKNFLK